MSSTAQEWEPIPADRLAARPGAAASSPIAPARGRWARLGRLAAQGALWLTFAFYLLLHAVGVVQAERTTALVGLLGALATGLALWLGNRQPRGSREQG